MIDSNGPPDVTPLARSVLFAGGGSGGHISPGLAIAEALRNIDPRITCHFAPSDREIDRTMLTRAGASFTAMPARPPKKSLRGFASFFGGWRRTFRDSSDVLRKRNIDHVVALGGFVSAPVVSAAVRLDIPVLLLNLDRVPGLANRMVARKADLVLSAVQTIQHGTDWPAVGLPIRSAAAARGTAEAARLELGLDPDRRTLLITGASQGARTINELAPSLCIENDTCRSSWQVLHLCGDEGLTEALQQRWDDGGVRARVVPFLHEMGLAWTAASLCISRAGANSVAEAWAAAVPTIFLPYPHHRDQHQRFNAQPMVERGGAVLVEDAIDADRTRRALAPVFADLVEDAGARAAMREILVRESPGDAAQRVARAVLGLR